MRSSRLGPLAIIVAGIAGLIEIWFEFSPPRLGYSDTDSPAVMLRFVRDHPEIYDMAGLALLVLAIALTIGVLAAHEALASKADALALRATTAFGLFSALLWFGHGAMRLSVQPMQHIQGLRQEWGEAAYLVTQMAGVHGFAQLGILTICLWALGLSLIGARTKALPSGLSVLGLVPVFRLLGILAPLGLLELLGPGLGEPLWIFFMLSIPGTWLWVIALGAILLRRSGQASGATSAVA